MQRKIEKRREELKEERFDASAGDGLVKVIVDGAGDLLRVEIRENAIEEEGLEMVTDLIVAAANNALTTAREHVDGELEKVTGGLKIPGIG